MQQSELSDEFYQNFSKGLVSEHQIIFKNPKSRKVIANLAEFLMKEKTSKQTLPSTLLGISLKIHPELNDIDFARNLYLLGHMFSKEKMFVRGEGLFAHAKGILESQYCYEKIEMYLLFGNMLRQIDIRRSEADQLVEKAKAEAAKMPVWYPYLVNLCVTPMDIN